MAHGVEVDRHPTETNEQQSAGKWHKSDETSTIANIFDHNDHSPVINEAKGLKRSTPNAADDECNPWFILSETSPTRSMSDMLHLAFSSQVPSKTISRVSPVLLDRVQLARLEDSYRDG
jgi:hypothetical protein